MQGNFRHNGHRMPVVHLKWYFNHKSLHTWIASNPRLEQLGGSPSATLSEFASQVFSAWRWVTYGIFHTICTSSVQALHRCTGFFALLPSTSFLPTWLPSSTSPSFLITFQVSPEYPMNESPNIEQRDCRERIEKLFHSEQRWLWAHCSRNPWVLTTESLKGAAGCKGEWRLCPANTFKTLVEEMPYFFWTLSRPFMHCPSHETKLLFKKPRPWDRWGFHSSSKQTPSQKSKLTPRNELVTRATVRYHSVVDWWLWIVGRTFVYCHFTAAGLKHTLHRREAPNSVGVGSQCTRYKQQ